VDWTKTVFEVIDMRSFSNLWYWIILAVVWSTASHWVLGVPFDMLTRARRQGGQAQTDLETMVRINVDRILYIGQMTGLLLLAFGSFALTMLAILGFWYDMEFAQAVFLIALPMSVVGALTVRTARIIAQTDPAGEALHRRLIRHRIATQLIGMVAIFVTAMYGMYVNFSVSPLY